VGDGEPGRLDGGAQLGGGDQVAAVRAIGPGQRVADRPGGARGDIPDREAAAVGQDPARFRVQTSLIGHVHLDMLADHHVEGGVGERQAGHVALPDVDLLVEAGDRVEPGGCLAVFRGQVDAGHLTAVLAGEEARGPADAGAGVEHPVPAGYPG
jgi:hypothetical protein